MRRVSRRLARRNHAVLSGRVRSYLRRLLADEFALEFIARRAERVRAGRGGEGWAR